MSASPQIHWLCENCDIPATSAIKQDLEIELECKKYRSYDEQEAMIESITSILEQNEITSWNSRLVFNV